MWRHAAVILGKDLRQRLRDRTVLWMAVGVPLLLAGLIGLALGGANEGLDLKLGLVATTDNAEARAFEAWLDQPWLEGRVLHHFESEEEARLAVAEQRLHAAVAFSEGAPRVLASREEVFAARGVQGLVDRFLAERVGTRSGRIVPRSPGGELRMIDYFAVTMAVLFLNFTVLGGVRALQQEKDTGALARLAAAPIHPLSLLIGKFGALLATGLIQMVVMIAATSLLFGTRWGNPIPLALLVVTSVFMAVGLTSFFMAWAGNAERGILAANIGIFVLAVIGGQFMPPQGLPDSFETLQRLTPNGQAARGFIDLAAAGPGAGLRVVLEPVLATLAVGVAGIAYGVRRASDVLHRAAA